MRVQRLRVSAPRFRASENRAGCPFELGLRLSYASMSYATCECRYRRFFFPTMSGNFMSVTTFAIGPYTVRGWKRVDTYQICSKGRQDFTVQRIQGCGIELMAST